MSDRKEGLHVQLNLPNKSNAQEVQTDLTSSNIASKLDELNQMTSMIVELERELKEKTFCIENLQKDEEWLKYFTGFPTYKVFSTVSLLITPFIQTTEDDILSPENQILLTLVKLRLNLDFVGLGYKFGISDEIAFKYFKNVLSIMCQRFKNLIFFPDRNILFQTMPHCFKSAFQETAAIIIDCLAIKIGLPGVQEWNKHKHSQIVKYLIGFTPQGTIGFISKGLEEKESVKTNLEQSDFLKNLIPGDTIIADREFLMREFNEIFANTVKIPALKIGKSQIQLVDLESTRGIFDVGLRVFKLIGLLSEEFHIIKGMDPIPFNWVGVNSEDHILDQIVFVCCVLINLYPAFVML